MTRRERRLYRTYDPRVVDIEKVSVLAQDGEEHPRYTLFCELTIVKIPLRLKIIFTAPGSDRVAYWQSALA